MSTRKLGKLGFRWLNQYDSNTIYELNDIVHYNNSTYIFKGTLSSNSLPTTTSDWDLFSESTYDLSANTGSLLYYDGNNIVEFPQGGTGQILTATNRKILEFDVTVASNGTSNNYFFTGTELSSSTESPSFDLAEGDTIIFNLDNTIATGNPLVIGTSLDANDVFDFTDQVTYNVNGINFTFANNYINYLNTYTVNSATITWKIPLDYTLSTNTAFYYNAKDTGFGNTVNVTDYEVANNEIVLEWQSYLDQSPHKVDRFPDNFSLSTYRYAAYVMKDQSIRSHGDNAEYRHGNGFTDDTEYPSRVAFPNDFSGVKKLKIAPYSSLVWTIDNNNHLWVWGYGVAGEHGTQTSDRIFRIPYNISTATTANTGYSGIDELFVATNPQGFDVLDVVDIKTSNSDNVPTILMVKDKATNNVELLASGYNAYGQLGISSSTSEVTTWGKVDLTNFGSNTITYVVGSGTNERTFFALDENKNLYSWGSNYYATLGRGIAANNGTYYQPTVIPYFLDNGIQIEKIRPGRISIYAIDTNNNLYAWGYNNVGQLGLGDTTNRDAPEFVLEGVEEIYTSMYDYDYVFALMTDGTIKSVGYGNYGCTGQGITGQLPNFTGVTLEDLTPITNVKKVALGGTDSYNSSAVLTNDGKIYVCGYNGNAQLGLGDTTQRLWFEELQINDFIRDIYFFGQTSQTILAILTENDDVYLSGYGGEGFNTELRTNLHRVPTPIIF